MKRVFMAIAFMFFCLPVIGWTCDTPTSPCPPTPPPSPYTPCTENLIVNGDFSAGNTGFSTDYLYIPDNADPAVKNELYGPKTYSIGTNPNLFHNAWGIFCDHTSGSGNMMIVNATCPTGEGTGCTESIPYNDRVWEQEVVVSPGRTYVFSYYVALSYGTNPPLLQVLINGQQVGLYDAGSNPPVPVGEWRLVSYTWNSGSATSAKITIVDQRPVYSGDDYALDDLSFCPQATTCLPTVWNLTAGQTIDVGSVTVTNDATNIYVTYTLDYPGAVFGELQMWVGNDLSLMPANPQGHPIPGQFCNSEGGVCSNGAADGLTSYTLTIPFTQVAFVDGVLGCGSSVYVVTHAEVLIDNNGDGSIDQAETAYGGPTPGGTQGAWWFYGLYTICCDGDQPPPACFKETAFAKGGWVWTEDPGKKGDKSNPEYLPSLNLTKNRWGWAINLTEPGTTTYDIWAGAGLNDTAKGAKVGTFTVNWDGTDVTATYTMVAGYYLGEVHLYAADARPTTTAPGQYGNLAEFDPIQNAYTFPPIPLADSNGTDGVWLIAHAVVSNGVCQ